MACVTFGHSFFAAILVIRQNGRRFPKPLKDVPKGYPLETISGRFGGPGGNVKIMVSSKRNKHFMVGGRTQRPFVQHFAHSAFEHGSRNDFFTIYCQFGLRKGSQGTTTEDPQTTFLIIFSSLFCVVQPFFDRFFPGESSFIDFG